MIGRRIERNNRISLMLDSGAFSAWTKGAQIDRAKYADFILENIQYLDYVVNLDMIPGSPGDKNVQGQAVEDSARKGYENYEYFLSRGVPKQKLIHVFHQNESFDWLRKMIKEMEYIGLSPANDRTTSEKATWLDTCMDYVTDEKGLPLVKFHGFAVTSVRLMVRYPWYSVDSTSWRVLSAWGGIYVPARKENKWVYDETSWIVRVSLRSPDTQKFGHHMSNYPPAVQQIMMAYFEEKGVKLGKSEFRLEPSTYQPKDNERWSGKANEQGQREVEVVIEPGLCNDYEERSFLNAVYFLDFQNSSPPWPWAWKRKSSRGFLR